MAKIDLPLLPPRLYRYRDVSSADLLIRELDAIAKAYLWFSQYRELNDPMEGFYGVSPWLARQTTFNRLSDEILNHKRAIGLCCFSDTHDNELMWAHYAGNYSGICVAYSSRQLREGLDDRVHVARVSYGVREPRIGRDNQDSPEQAARTILSHKKACWEYEREWRMLTGPDAMQIPGRLEIASKSSVKGVYVGNRMDDDIRATLEGKLARLDIPLYTMRVGGYQHEWKSSRRSKKRS